VTAREADEHDSSTDDIHAELAALEERSPPWQCWIGVNDRLYARVPNSVVPLQRADTVSELEALMKAEQATWL
jgi:hypothetical protein